MIWRFGQYSIPGDSGQTPARSICLKFACPTSRITRHLPRSFLEWTNALQQMKKEQTEAIEYGSLYFTSTVQFSVVCKFSEKWKILLVKLFQKRKITMQIKKKQNIILQMHRPSTIHQASYQELSGTAVLLQADEIRK